MDQRKQYLTYHHNLSLLVHSARFLDLPRDKKQQTLIRFCCQVLAVDVVTTWRLAENRQDLVRDAWYSGSLDSPELPPTLVLDDPLQALLDQLWTEGIQVVSDAGAHPLIGHLVRRAAPAADGHTMILAPLYSASALAGVLVLHWHRTTADWSPAEQAFMHAIADKISLLQVQESWLSGQEELEHLAYHDDETGLPNRRLLDRKISAEVLAPPDSAPLVLIWVDIDRFKSVTDSLGPAAGTLATQTLAHRLAACGTANDMVARLSKDEFVILARYQYRADATQAQQVAAVESAIRQPLQVQDTQLSLTASIGVASHTSQSDTLLLEQAEAAMLEAKATGGNRVVWFSQAMQDRRSQRVGLESLLRQALEQNELALHYQPVFGVEHGDVVAYEALIRWPQPNDTLRMPGDFLPLADRAGLMLDIDNYVLALACADKRRMLDTGEEAPVAANISGLQLTDETFPDQLKQLLDHNGLEGRHLELELTESALRGDTFTIATTLQRIAELGVRLAIDDFGTGYSSLGRLKYLPFHKLKIDRSFIVDTPDDPDVCAMMDAILNLAQGLSLQVVAEGIENDRQGQWASQRGCQFLQGFHLGRPKALAYWLDNPPAGRKHQAR